QSLASAEGGAIDPGVQQAIQQARGGGQPLPEGVRGAMEQALGTDFSGVRVHTGAQADQLNRVLQARAFTTGRDIFLRRGEYTPGGRAGRELLAHELTHVVQQTGNTKIGVSKKEYGAETVSPSSSDFHDTTSSFAIPNRPARIKTFPGVIQRTVIVSHNN